MVVAGVEFDEHVIFPGRKVTLHNLRNGLQCLGHGIKRSRILQINADIGTCFIANFLRVDDEPLLDTNRIKNVINRINWRFVAKLAIFPSTEMQSVTFLIRKDTEMI